MVLYEDLLDACLLNYPLRSSKKAWSMWRNLIRLSSTHRRSSLGRAPDMGSESREPPILSLISSHHVQNKRKAFPRYHESRVTPKAVHTSTSGQDSQSGREVARTGSVRWSHISPWRFLDLKNQRLDEKTSNQKWQLCSRQKYIPQKEIVSMSRNGRETETRRKDERNWDIKNAQSGGTVEPERTRIARNKLDRHRR